MGRGWLLGNALWLQAGWWGCVQGAHSPWLLWGVALGLIVHVCLCPHPGSEARALVLVAVAGCVVDSLLGAVGVFGFAQQPLPLWLAVLWLVLASGLRHSLAWAGRRLWLGMLAGLVGGPLAYLAGAGIADVALPLGRPVTALLLAPLWALLLPLLVRLATWR